MSKPTSCPFCGSSAGIEQLFPSELPAHERPFLRVDCRTCGRYQVQKTPAVVHTKDYGQEVLVALSHRVRQLTIRLGREDEWPLVPQEMVLRAREDTSLPTIAEQLDNLTLYLGQNQREPAYGVSHDMRPWQAIVGAKSELSARMVFVAGEANKVVEYSDKSNPARPGIRLTFAGWQRFEDLVRARIDSRRAFMAMSFRDPRVDRVFGECFVPAVALTGFKLFRVDQDPKAGLIDDRIRVAIQTSRFIVADLTGGNPGAYWEAGFGEGLRRPVIYTCEQSYFDEHKGTHFDTRNRQTVVWSESDLGKAAEDIKASIRATLPDEAIMEDPPAEGP